MARSRAKLQAALRDWVYNGQVPTVLNFDEHEAATVMLVQEVFSAVRQVLGRDDAMAWFAAAVKAEESRAVPKKRGRRAGVRRDPQRDRRLLREYDKAIARCEPEAERFVVRRVAAGFANWGIPATEEARMKHLQRLVSERKAAVEAERKVALLRTQVPVLTVLTVLNSEQLRKKNDIN